MRSDEALAILGAADLGALGRRAALGLRQGAAYLRVLSIEDDRVWATVSTPGDRWVALDVNGGFSANHFEEGIIEDDLREILARYVEAACLYVSGRSLKASRGWLGVRKLAIPLAGEDFELRKSIGGDLRDILLRSGAK